MATKPSWRQVGTFEYAKEEFTANPDQCRKCFSAIWTVIARSGFRVRLDPEVLSAQQKLDAYLAGEKVYISWRTAGGFEVENATGLHLISDDGSRPMLAVHKCRPKDIRAEVIDPYTITKATISITQVITDTMEAPF